MSASAVLLASASPRRRRMLEEIGLDVMVAIPALDDARAPIAEKDPRRLVEALAWFKAAQILGDDRAATARGQTTLLIAADTVCVVDGRVIGKPRDELEAREFIEGFMNRCHEVLTGVCLVDLRDGSRRLFSDQAVVSLGALESSALEAHLAAGAWRGRAGGYNYSEAIEAGWPLSVDGDPATVMGLPMSLLAPLLRNHGESIGLRSA